MGSPADWSAIVPFDFEVPTGLGAEGFLLEPLRLRHNEADHAAWTSSIAHIRATPGFADRSWPDRAGTLAENRMSIERHIEHAAQRLGFTYTVLDRATGEVIGCVYFYPPRRSGYDVDVRSWVRADRALLDKPVYLAVRQWLAEAWPFVRPDYAVRP